MNPPVSTVAPLAPATPEGVPPLTRAQTAHHPPTRLGFLSGTAAILAAVALDLAAKDHPQFGQAWSRNMVSDERHLPERFDPKWDPLESTCRHASLSIL